MDILIDDVANCWNIVKVKLKKFWRSGGAQRRPGIVCPDNIVREALQDPYTEGQ